MFVIVPEAGKFEIKVLADPASSEKLPRVSGTTDSQTVQGKKGVTSVPETFLFQKTASGVWLVLG